MTKSRFKDASTSLGAPILIIILDMDQDDLSNVFMHCALDGAKLSEKKLDEFLMVGKEILKNPKRSP